MNNRPVNKLRGVNPTKFVFPEDDQSHEVMEPNDECMWVHDGDQTTTTPAEIYANATRYQMMVPLPSLPTNVASVHLSVMSKFIRIIATTFAISHTDAQSSDKGMESYDKCMWIDAGDQIFTIPAETYANSTR